MKTLCNPKPLVILVHPGSLCGSFQTAHDWHPHWHQYADCRREQICAEFNFLDANRVVVLGTELDDEIPDYAMVQNAVNRATRAYHATPCAGELNRTAARIWRRHSRNAHSILVTGAWADRKDGCAWNIYQALRGLAGTTLAVRLSPIAPRHQMSRRQIEAGPVHPLGNNQTVRWHVARDREALAHNERRLQDYMRSQPAWSELARRLKSIGGTAVCPSIEEDMALILAHGRTWAPIPRDLLLRRGERSRCHQNSLYLWDVNRHLDVVTGYALSADGIWRSHSWCFDPGCYRVIETTEKRIAYHGALLSKTETLLRLAEL